MSILAPGDFLSLIETGHLSFNQKIMTGSECPQKRAGHGGQPQALSRTKAHNDGRGLRFPNTNSTKQLNGIEDLAKTGR